MKMPMTTPMGMATATAMGMATPTDQATPTEPTMPTKAVEIPGMTQRRAGFLSQEQRGIDSPCSVLAEAVTLVRCFVK